MDNLYIQLDGLEIRARVSTIFAGPDPVQELVQGGLSAVEAGELAAAHRRRSNGADDWAVALSPGLRRRLSINIVEGELNTWTYLDGRPASSEQSVHTKPVNP